jgi:hypothetical protein
MALMDGTANYRRLSDEDLAKAKAAADPVLNPLDWENVRLEAKRRKVKRREKLLPIMTRVVGWYLLLGCVIGLFAVQKVATAGSAVFLLLAAGVLIMWGIAGVLLLAKWRAGRLLGVIALAFQLPVIDVTAFSYHFRPFYGVVVGLLDSNIQFLLNTGTKIALRPNGGPASSLAVDLVAGYGIVILLRSMRRAKRQTHAAHRQA